MKTHLEIEVELKYNVTEGTSDYFSRSFGNWLPGDPPEVELEAILLNGIDISEHLSAEQIEDLYEHIYAEENI